MKKTILTFLLFASTAFAQQLQWTLPAVQISASMDGSSEPQVAVDAAGDAISIWTANGAIKSARKVFGQDWSSPFTVTTGISFFSPQLAVDPDGNAVAVWVVTNGMNSKVQAATLPAGSETWSSTVDISATSTLISSPEVTVDPDGNAVAVWLFFDGMNENVQSATKLFGMSWSSAVNIVTSGTITSPQVGVDSSGNAVAVWSISTRIQAALKPFGMAWSSATNVSSAGSFTGSVALAVDLAGDAVAVWRNTSNGTLQSATKLAGSGSWSTPITLPLTGTTPSEEQVAINSSGNAVAVWSANVSGNTEIEAASLPLGQAWSALSILSTSGTDSFAPDIGLDSSGNATAVWSEVTGGHDLVRASTQTAGSSWPAAADAIDLSTLGDDSDNPKIALDSSGNAVVVWNTTTMSDSVIQATTGLAIAPPSQLLLSQKTNDFALLSELYNQLQWSASSTNDLLGYHIYRNGVLIASVGPSVLSYQDHNRQKNISTTYSVTAFNSTSESTAITGTIN